jgi:hypothetical protein
MSFQIFIDPHKADSEVDDVLIDRYRVEVKELKSIIEALKNQPGTYARWEIIPYTARKIAKMSGLRQQLSLTSDPKSRHTIVKLKETK